METAVIIKTILKIILVLHNVPNNSTLGKLRNFCKSLACLTFKDSFSISCYTKKKKKKKCQEFELIDELIFLLIHTVMTKLCGQSSGIIFPKLFYICIVTNFDSVATRYWREIYINIWELSILSKYYFIITIFAFLRVFLYISISHSKKRLCDFQDIRKPNIVSSHGLIKNWKIRFSFYILFGFQFSNITVQWKYFSQSTHCIHFGNNIYYSNRAKNHNDSLK